MRAKLQAAIWRGVCAMIAWLAILADYAISLFFYASAAFATKLVVVIMATNLAAMLFFLIVFKRMRFVHLEAVNAREGAR